MSHVSPVTVGRGTGLSGCGNQLALAGLMARIETNLCERRLGQPCLSHNVHKPILPLLLGARPAGGLLAAAFGLIGSYTFMHQDLYKSRPHYNKPYKHLTGLLRGMGFTWVGCSGLVSETVGNG